MARYEILEHAQTFYPELTIITDQLNPLANRSKKDSSVDD